MYLKTTAVREDTEDMLFDRIGLTLSGGGYRAAAFHLGSMSYLYRLKHPDDGRPLLERVKFLSTISGGTITGAVYAAALVEHGNQAFPHAYRRLLRFMEEDHLLQRGLDRLQPSPAWPEAAAGKARNLINAFSLQYRSLTTNYTFDQLCKRIESEGGATTIHLREVAFGATDLRNGLPFRFQNAGILGNNYLRVPQQYWKHLYLGDIIAASSAFPGGFEPIRFPDDFLAAPAAAEDLQKLRRRDSFREPVDLLDGGIVSNQGFDALEQFLNRNRVPGAEAADSVPLTLLIACDVASYYHPRPATVKMVPANDRSPQLRTLVVILLVLVFLFGVLGLSRPLEWILLLVFGSARSAAIGWQTWTSLILAMLIVGLTAALISQWVRPRIQDFPDSAKHLLASIRSARLGRLTIRQYAALLRSRIASLGYVVGDVFLSRNRRRDTKGVYRTLADDRVLSNYIYTLAKDTGGKDALPILSSDLSPRFLSRLTENGLTIDDLNGSQLPNLASRAEEFGTVLWFTAADKRGDMLRTLVAAGQFTLCYSLLMKTNDLLRDAGGKQEAAILHITDQLQQDFKRFQCNPYWLYEECAILPG